MRRLVLVVNIALMLVACSETPDPSVPVAEWANRIDAHVENVPSAPDASAPIELMIDAASKPYQVPDSVRGFYCAEFRYDGKSPTRCFRSLGACREVREVAIREKNQEASECVPRERAFCFGMTNDLALETHWRCADTNEQCELDLTWYKGLYPDLKAGECALFASLPTSGPPHATYR